MQPIEFERFTFDTISGGVNGYSVLFAMLQSINRKIHIGNIYIYEV